MKKIFPISLIVIITSSIYSGVLWGGFLRDDFPFVTENRWITSARYIPDILTSEQWAFYHGDFVTGPTNYYRPLISMIHMGVYSLFGLNPVGYHLINLIFHNLNSILVFLIAFSILGRGTEGPAQNRTQSDNKSGPAVLALFAALVFAVHPVNVEPVAWVSSIAELCYAFFCLLSFYLYIRSGRALSMGGVLYVLSVLSFVFALLTKETAVAFPALIVAYDFLFKKPSFTAIKRYIPFALAVGAFFFIRSRIVGSLAAEHAVPAYGYMLAIASLASQYFGKLIYPFNLKVYFPFQWPTSITELLTREAFFTFFLAALLVFYLYRFRGRRTVILGAVWAVIFISPAILMVKYIHGECAFAGRYLYLSTAGFAVVCAAWFRDACGAWEKPGPRKMVIAAFGAAVLAAFAADTVISSKAWRNEFSHWKQAAAEAPQSPMARANYGFALSEKGLYEEAVREYEAVFALIPEGGNEYIKPGGIYLNLGVVYYNTGEPDKAAAAFEKAIPLVENSVIRRDLHAKVGRIYLEKGMAKESIPHLEKAVSGGQPDAGLYNMLGIAYGQGGHIDRAADAFNNALAIDPNHAGARKNLNIILDGTAGGAAPPR